MELELGPAVHSVVVPDGMSIEEVRQHFGPNFDDNFDFDNVKGGQGLVEYVQLPMDLFDTESLHVAPVGDTGAACIQGDLLTDADMTPDEESEMLNHAIVAENGTDAAEDWADHGADEDFEDAVDVALGNLRNGIMDARNGGNGDQAAQALQDFLQWLGAAFPAGAQGSGTVGKSENVVADVRSIKSQIAAIRADLQSIATRTDSSGNDSVVADAFGSMFRRGR